MKKEILTIVACSLVASPVFADDNSRASKHETAGLGSGFAVGAILGGPVGAILGGAVGGWFGNKFNKEHTARVESETQFEIARANANELEAELFGSEQRIAKMQREILAEERAYRAALQEALNAEVFFHTGETQLHEESVERLGRIAKLVGSMDDFVIRLAGHADSRGDEEYNEQLSAARAAAVRDAMVAAGFPSARIAITAEGESLSNAEEGDLDALALERRVQIELISTTDDPLVARQ